MNPTYLHFIFSTSTPYNVEYVFGVVLGIFLILVIPTVFILSLVKFIITKRKPWLVGLIISGLFACAFIVLISYSVFQGYTNASAEIRSEGGKQQKTKPVSTEDGLLTFKVPTNWEALSELSELGSLGYGHLRNEQCLVVISEPKLDFADDVTLEDYAQLCLENTSEVASEYELGEWTSSEVAGRSLNKIQVFAVIDNLKIKYLNGYLETETHYHQIMQWSLPSKWEQSLTLFESVLYSVEPRPDSLSKEE